MIFVANALVVNGGTTFLIRTCCELQSQGERCAVILLRNEYDSELLAELASYAEIIYLENYLVDAGFIFRKQLGIFGFVNWDALIKVISKYTGQIHVMGVLGLIFSLRLIKKINNKTITVGIYHQNEFLYSGIPFYFASEVLRLFRLIPSENIIFFNESTRNNYEKFYSKKYSSSIVTPIGIKIRENGCLYNNESCKIVSIGNLVNFKTYNRHIIELMPDLLIKYPNVSYHIYGAGVEELNLRRLVEKLNVGNSVHFNGVIPYSNFDNVVSDAALFVGSGTSLIEAAALGVPALIGIESITTSETYGFLCDIKGLSYNENIAEIPKKSMKNLIEELFDNPKFRSEISIACKLKSAEFSIVKTAEDLIKLNKYAIPVSKVFPWSYFLKLFFSFMLLVASARIGMVAPFNQRRGQSF